MITSKPPEICLRLKRHKTTWFIETDASHTVRHLKERFLTILNGSISADSDGAAPGAGGGAFGGKKGLTDIKLQVPNSKQPGTYAGLEDTGVLGELLNDDDVVYVTFWESNEANPGDGKWEAVNVPEFEPLNDQMDVSGDDFEHQQQEPQMSAASKAKGKAPAVLP
ncbi:hypothetical protein HK102_001552 [Quaeritorhiza haematococci]|nr:hypothetical protein HK102_001552 [Quaeritorhiza haematococci]